MTVTKPALKDMGSPISEKARQSHGMSLTSFLASLTFSASVFVIEMLIFLFLRGRVKHLYQPRAASISRITGQRNRNHPWRILSDSEILQRCGLDAYFFLRYLRTVLKIFLILTAFILPILVPLNVLHGKDYEDGAQGMDRLSWANVGLTQNKLYWANLVLIVTVSALICISIYCELTTFVRFRQSYLQSRSRSHSARTILVTGIPKHLLSTEDLSRLYDVFSDGVETVTINQDLSAIVEILAERDEVLANLEVAETDLLRQVLKAEKNKYRSNGEVNKLMRNRRSSHEKRPTVRLPILPWLPSLPLVGTKVDTIDHSRRNLSELSQKISSTQKICHGLPQLPSAFIEFKSQIAAHIACQTIAHHNTLMLNVRCIYVGPQDVLWENLSITWTKSCIRSVLVTFVISILILGWALPVAFTGFLSQVAYAPIFWPKFGYLSAPLRGLILGVLPQIVLTILLILVPYVIRYCAGKQGFLTVRNLELAIQRYYFIFLFVQVFLTVSISSSATTIIGDIYHGFDSIPLVLANNLPKTSNYFSSYMLMQGLSISANQCLNVVGLIGRLIWSPHREKSARSASQRSKAAFDVQWGTVFPVFTNLACIAFGLFYGAFRHKLIDVSKAQRNSDGLFYPVALFQLFTGLYVMEAYALGLFLLARDKDGRLACIAQAAIVTVLLGATIISHIFLYRSFTKPVEFLCLVPSETGRSRDRGYIGKILSATGLNGPGEVPFEISDPYHFDGSEESFQQNALGTDIPVIWLPQDPMGMSNEVILAAKSSHPGLLMSNEHASLDEHGNLMIDGDPPKCARL